MSEKTYCLISFVLVLFLVSGVNAELISHYTFDTDYSDSGTLPRTGTAHGSVLIDATPGAGPLGTTGYLDLNGGYVELPAYDGPGWVSATGVTITAWVKQDVAGSGGYIFAQNWFSPSDGTIQILTTPAGIYAQSLVNVNAATGPYGAAGQWYHVAWVGRAITGLHEIWINGEKVAETWMPWAAWPGHVFKAMHDVVQIGAWGGGTVLMGGIDDLRVYTDTLGEAAIKDIAGVVRKKALEPIPANGAGDVKTDVLLQWAPGTGVVTHNVYLSTVEQEVANRTVTPVSVTEANYTPTALNIDTTYYWRVDEVNNLDPCSPWGSNVWSFTTANFLIVDDMESYNLSTPRIYNTWIDGYTNGSGSVVDLGTTNAHGGAKSMQYYYDNSVSPYYSESMADTAGLQIGTNWTVSGVKSLDLWFRGTVGNSVSGMMYFAVEDGSTPTPHFAMVRYGDNGE